MWHQGGPLLHVGRTEREGYSSCRNRKVLEVMNVKGALCIVGRVLGERLSYCWKRQSLSTCVLEISWAWRAPHVGTVGLKLCHSSRLTGRCSHLYALAHRNIVLQVNIQLGVNSNYSSYCTCEHTAGFCCCNRLGPLVLSRTCWRHAPRVTGTYLSLDVSATGSLPREHCHQICIIMVLPYSISIYIYGRPHEGIDQWVAGLSKV